MAKRRAVIHVESGDYRAPEEGPRSVCQKRGKPMTRDIDKATCKTCKSLLKRDNVRAFFDRWIALATDPYTEPLN